MTNIQLPVVRYPFASRMNQHADAAQQHITGWVNEMGLLTTEKAWQKFHKAKFAYLVARAFPDAGLHELCLIADFNTWLFILDDKCDEAAEGRKADYLRSIMAGLLDILQHNIVYLPAGGHPLAAALACIRPSKTRMHRNTHNLTCDRRPRAGSRDTARARLHDTETTHAQSRRGQDHRAEHIPAAIMS